MRFIDLIVIHCSATRENTDYSIDQLKADHLKRGFSDVGYHYYIKRSGEVMRGRPFSRPGAHARGFNSRSIGICYEGGLDVNGKPKDTRTELQKAAILNVINYILEVVAKAEQEEKVRIVGHRDLSKDKNQNGKIDPWERMKECPCYDAIPEYEWITV